MSDTLNQNNPFRATHPSQTPVGKGNLRISDGGKFAPQMTAERGPSAYNMGPMSLLLKQLGLTEQNGQNAPLRELSPELRMLMDRMDKHKYTFE